MKSNTSLLKHLVRQKCILFSKRGFKTKWGQRFSFETDIRPAFLTHEKAKETSHLIYDLVRESVRPFDFILGVPETGTMMAFFLNDIHARSSRSDLPVNLLRANPKPYQGVTANTVQPLSKTSRIILIEDDVVSGKTLLSYVRTLHRMGMRRVQVVSVIDRQIKDARGKTVKNRVEGGFGYPYRTLITLEDIKSIAPRWTYEA